MSLILVIDDSMTDLQITRIVLEKTGFLVITARNGQEAKDKVSSHKPDLIVLDVVLPGCSGFKLCRALKEEIETREIPIIMCSSKSSNMDRYWGLQQGADAYISKPIQPEKLLEVLQKLL